MKIIKWNYFEIKDRNFLLPISEPSKLQVLNNPNVVVTMSFPKLINFLNCAQIFSAVDFVSTIKLDDTATSG